MKPLKPLKPLWIAVPLITLFLGSAVLIQYQFDKPGFDRLQKGFKLKYYKVDEGVHLLPSPLVLRSLSAGFNSVMSEFLMLKSLNYFYQYRYSGRDSEYQNRIYSGVTELNPYYFDAYRYGGYFLNGPFRMKTDALSSFKKGTASLTRKELRLSPAWMHPPKTRQQVYLRKEYIPSEQAVKLMLETAIHYFAYLKDNVKGAEICRYGQRVFPKYRNDFLDKELTLRSETGQFKLIMEIWKRFVEINQDNANKKSLGMYMIKKYSSLYGVDQLSERIKAVYREKGAYPENLLQIAGPSACIDGFGDVFIYFRESGSIYSRMLEKENIDSRRNFYIQKVKQWYKDNEAYPASLEKIEFAKNEYIHIPFEIEYRYNPDTGVVELPFGFGSDICRLLKNFVSAEYVHADRKKAFIAGGNISLLTEYFPDENIKAEVNNLLKRFSSYTIGFIPGAIPFGLYAASPLEGMYIAKESGPVYFNPDMKTIESWPENISEWKVLTP